MQGKICLVTGATNGIGEVTAHELAKMGATVVIVGRNPQKTAQVVADIKAKSGNPNIDSIVADLSYGADVMNVANTFKSRYNRLDVLVNNAGAVIFTQETSKDGLEMTFALNHMSYFTLTNALLDLIIASGTPTQKARIVNVSSSLHASSPLDFNDLQTINPFNGYKAYCRSKLMNVMFTKELDKRLQSQNAPVTVNALHPGVVKTGFARNNTKGIFGVMISLFMPILLFWRITPEQGAKTQLYLASSPEVEGVSGKYFDKSKVVPSSPASLVEADWVQLWAMSEQIDNDRLKKG
ncbi:MAG: SDR family oxidoreductase [bacterium]|nr:SDR family oxidoreductase [bacterium]